MIEGKGTFSVTEFLVDLSAEWHVVGGHVALGEEQSGDVGYLVYGEGLFDVDHGVLVRVQVLGVHDHPLVVVRAASESQEVVHPLIGGLSEVAGDGLSQPCRHGLWREVLPVGGVQVLQRAFDDHQSRAQHVEIVL